QKPDYAAGNILNLLVQQNIDIRGLDFSDLTIWQAYLQGAILSDTNFMNADLAQSVFTDTFGGILSVTISPKGDLLAVGTTGGEIRLWHAATGTPLWTSQEQITDSVYSVAFS